VTAREATIFTRSKKTALIIPEGFEKFNYGPGHPLKWERITYAMELIHAYGLDKLENSLYLSSAEAPIEEALSYHSPDYIGALKSANDGAYLPEHAKYNIGPGDNPVFPGVLDFSLTVLGNTMMAARTVAEGKAWAAFNMAGGMHHAMKDRAAGFCFVNDIVIAIEYLVKKKFKVMYVDIDAHHGDGVQAAFYDSDRVLTLSFHESGKSLFPGTGFTEEIGAGKGKGYSLNVPLRYGTDDRTFMWAFDDIFVPVIEKFSPDILISQVGCDMMLTDPLANLNLTSQGYIHAVTKMRQNAKRWIALGGGGYNHFNTARLWTMVWAIMNDVTLPNELPREFVQKAHDEGFDLTGLSDHPFRLDEWRKQDVMVEAGKSIRDVQRDIFSLLKIKTKKRFFDDLFS
jgi:acetoin utilization protein AcuC